MDVVEILYWMVSMILIGAKVSAHDPMSVWVSGPLWLLIPANIDENDKITSAFLLSVPLP